MSTLDGPIWSRCSIALTCTDKARKKGKRRAGEKKKQAADFEEAVGCPTVIVQGAA